MAFIRIARLEDIPPLGARRYRRDDGKEIAVFRTAADTVFALRDKCPHKGGPLSQGIVFGESRRLPAAQLVHRPRRRQAAAPDEGSVERFAVRVEDGHGAAGSRIPAVARDDVLLARRGGRRAVTTPAHRDALHLLLLRRGLRRRHREPTASASPACAAIRITRPTAASSARKGTTLHLTASPAASAGRARYPGAAPRPRPRRASASPGTRRSTTWRERFAADHRASTAPIRSRFYVSGQLLTEDYYVFNKLAKALIGTANIDTNSRLCMSSAVTGYQQTLGVDAPPCSYEDIDHAQCLFIAGSNMAYAHPVLFRRIEAARAAQPGAEDRSWSTRAAPRPRASPTCTSPSCPAPTWRCSTRMLHVMLWEDLVDRDYIAAHVEGFDALRDAVRDWTPQAAAEMCGVKAEDIVTAARWFAQSPATLSLYCQGLNQSTSGTAKNAALINLHLATGQIGKPGAGPFSLTGQPNAMGGREVGGLATSLAAHRDLASEADRAEMARLWGVDRLSGEPGKTAVEMFEALETRRDQG